MFVFNIGYKLKWQKSKNYKNFGEGLVILYWHPKHNFSVKCKNLMSTPTWLRNQFLFFILFLQLVNIQVLELRGCQSPSLQTLTIPCKCTDHLFSGGKDREHLHLEGGGPKVCHLIFSPTSLAHGSMPLVVFISQRPLQYATLGN